MFVQFQCIFLLKEDLYLQLFVQFFFRRLAANDCVQMLLIVQSQTGWDMNKNGSIGIDSQLSDQVDDDN